MSHTIDRCTRNTLGDALRRVVSKHPEREAIIFSDRRWSFRKLENAVNAVAHRLLDLGLEPGDRIAAFGRNSDAYLILWLACNRIGAIHVPCNYALVPEELAYLLRQSGASAIFHDAALAGTVETVLPDLESPLTGTIRGGGDREVLSWALTNEGIVTRPEEAWGEDSVAQILYTSGTTALPKGAMLTHRAIQAEYASCIIHLDFSEHDRALAGLPLYHSAQMHVFTMPQLLLGATTMIIEAPEPACCLELIERERITSFFAPPTVWIALLRHQDFDRRDLTSLKNAYYGASIMPEAIVQELGERLPGVRLYNCYGQSEIAPLATVLSPEDHAHRPTSAGKPVFNVETRIVDEEMNDVGSGEVGEIVHRSPQLLSGYWQKPEETAAAFEGGWFHSGDLGYLDEAGYLYIVDRVKDVVNTGGVVVSSREVEEVLYTHEEVSQVAVIGLPHEQWIEMVTAVIVPMPGERPDEEALTRHARHHLAPFKIPKRYIFVDELPVNSAGKVLKRELRKRYAPAEQGTAF